MDLSGLVDDGLVSLGVWVGKTRFVEVIELRETMSSAPTVSSGVMDLIILIVICSLACAFLLYVLLQWMRDTKSKPAGRLATGDEGKQGDSKKGVGRK